MSLTPGGAYYAEFTTANPTTGAAQSADSLPAATANRNGTDDGAFALTVVLLDTGRYKITGTIPGGYGGGDSVWITVAATVAGVAGKAPVDSFLVVGPTLAATALDAIVIEAGINARQALALILAADSGKLSGANPQAGTNTIVIVGANNATPRITALTDAAGNRTAVTLTPPA